MIFHKKELALARSILTQKVREFFTGEKFLEVETPVMTPIPGMEPHLTPFKTEFKSLHQNFPLYLNTSPELQMKKLLGAGFGNIFNITKVFRNGEIGGDTHNPEFTMIEWYREKADYKDLMKDCENLIRSLTDRLIYQGQEIDLSLPWDRKTTHELFQEYCKIDLLENQTFEEFKKTAEKLDFDTKACEDWDDIFFKIFLNHIEPHLGKEKPIFVYDYPSTQAALAKKSATNPFFAERFELYIAGIELCNAFGELTDANEQRSRLLEEQKLRKKLGKTVFPIDEEFLASLESIHYESAGIALGLDRLFMVLLDKKSIEEVLLFPLSKLINN